VGRIEAFGYKPLIRFSFIEQFGNRHLDVALRTVGQVFDRQIDDLRVATLRADDFDRFTVATFHPLLPLCMS
jgi:hypothetical protein